MNKVKLFGLAMALPILALSGPAFAQSAPAIGSTPMPAQNAPKGPVTSPNQSLVNTMAQQWIKAHGPVAPGNFVPVGGTLITVPSAFRGQIASTQHIPNQLVPQNPRYYVVSGQLVNGHWIYPFTPISRGKVAVAWFKDGINTQSHTALYEVGTIAPDQIVHVRNTATTASTGSDPTNVAWGLTARWDNVGNPIFAVLDQVTWNWNAVTASDVSNNITTATWNQIPYYYNNFFHNRVTYSSGGYIAGSAAWFAWPDDYDYWSPIDNGQYTNYINNTANADTLGTVHNPETGSTITVNATITGDSSGYYWYTSSSPCSGVACGLLNSPNIYYDLSS